MLCMLFSLLGMSITLTFPMPLFCLNTQQTPPHPSNFSSGVASSRKSSLICLAKLRFPFPYLTVYLLTCALAPSLFACIFVSKIDGEHLEIRTHVLFIFGSLLLMWLRVDAQEIREWKNEWRRLCFHSCDLVCYWTINFLRVNMLQFCSPCVAVAEHSARKAPQRSALCRSSINEFWVHEWHNSVGWGKCHCHHTVEGMESERD